MASVTQRVSKVQQPYGGYLPMKSFRKEIFNDGITLYETENIHASLVGLAVDYLTRFSLGDSVDKAFHISCLGAANIGMLSEAEFYKANVTGLDDHSIISACKLAGFDVCFRSSPSSYKPIENINPDSPTIENIRIMVNRAVYFWRKYGPIECSEPTFEGGYTDTVTSGDGDFLTKDTLWDFKVSKSAPTTKHSLQVLMYYVMGLHSIYDHFKSITNLGFFNPRLNVVYICPISKIPAETIADIENNVICYGTSASINDASYSIPSTMPQSNMLSVADVCSMTGLNKKVIYADIRSGLLRANKIGNKYYVSKSDYIEYKKRKEVQQSILVGVVIVIVIVFILTFLSMY